MNKEPETPTPSPLYEADPESLSILFDRIDQNLLKNLPIIEKDVEKLVEYYISERQRFVRDQSQFIKPTRARAAPGQKRNLSDAINEAELKAEF